MEDCIFCKIVTGEIPCYKIYEDELTLAFLDISPITEGFTLVIPKKHSPYLWDIDDEDYAALMSTVQKVGRRIRDIFQPRRVGLQVEGLDVQHAHVKVFAFNTAGEYRSLPPRDEPDHEALSKIADELHFD